jgi:ADP-dependent NAD(P)H-hydrate dehydratase / NAD(P)H-hydrate epimerase
VLTGMITALIAQGYEPMQATLLAVYIHGAAGDKAAAAMSMESMIAGDIVKNIGEVFLSFQNK